MHILVRMPCRIDLAGGWSDTCFNSWYHPAAVLNVSIDYLRVEVRVRPSPRWQLLYNGREQKENLPIETALRFLGKDRPPIEVEVSNSIPKESGLGGSSILVCAVLAAVQAFHGARVDNTRLINQTLAVEELMGSRGGWQDQVGALYPGVKLIQTDPSKPGEYDVRIRFSQEIEERCLLIDTGVRRKAFGILSSLAEKCQRKDRSTLKMLERIRENALLGWSYLQLGRYDDLAKLMSDSWALVCDIEPQSRIKEVDDIEGIIGQDLLGGKLAGAGGGGFYFAIVKNREEVIKRLANFEVYKPRFNKCLQIKKF